MEIINNFLDKIKNYTIVLLFIICIILLLTRGCGTKVENNCETIHDTIRRHTVDTIWPPVKTITKYITKFNQPIIDTIIIDNSQHIISTYSDSLIDSNLVIRYKDQIEGKFISKVIGYTLFIPKTIIKKDFVQIKETEFITKQPKFTMFIGGIIGGNKNELSTIEPIGGITINKNAIFYGYNFVNQTHNIGFYKTLFKSKK